MLQSRRLASFATNDLVKIRNLSYSHLRQRPYSVAIAAHINTSRDGRAHRSAELNHRRRCCHNIVMPGKRFLHTGLEPADAIAASITPGMSPVILMQNMIEAAHVYGHMPWWCVIDGRIVLRSGYGPPPHLGLRRNVLTRSYNHKARKPPLQLLCSAFIKLGQDCNPIILAVIICLYFANRLFHTTQGRHPRHQSDAPLSIYPAFQHLPAASFRSPGAIAARA